MNIMCTVHIAQFMKETTALRTALQHSFSFLLRDDF